MIVDRHDPVDVLQLVPKLRLQMEPELCRLDELLCDDELFLAVKADLSRRYPNSGSLGRHSTPVEVILRMLVVRRLYDWSYEATERNVSDSLVLRQFCRLYLEPAPDDTTLIRWAATIGNETLLALNERAVQLAVGHEVTRGRKLRIDGTVVETNIHHPTEASLLADGVRVMARLLGKGKAALPGAPKGLFRDRTRSAKRLLWVVTGHARGQGERAEAAVKEGLGRLLGVAEATLRQAGRVEKLLSEAEGGLVRELERYSDLLGRVVEGTRRRALGGEHVAAGHKVVSLFEPHTAIIKRGRAHKATEFGRKVWLDEVEGGIVSGYRVLVGNAPDGEQLVPALRHHTGVFGRAPDLVAADRLVYSASNERGAQEAGVGRVCLPKRGRKTEERQDHERQGWFRRGMRWRAGLEGRISVMKRRGWLGRCRDKGESGFNRWIGWGVLMANLSTIARKLAT